MKRRKIFLHKIILVLTLLIFTDKVCAQEVSNLSSGFGTMQSKGYSGFNLQNLNNYGKVIPQYTTLTGITNPGSYYATSAGAQMYDTGNSGFGFKFQINVGNQGYVQYNDQNAPYVLFKKLYKIEGILVDVKVTINKLESTINSNQIRIYLNRLSDDQIFLGYGIYNGTGTIQNRKSYLYDMAYLTIQLYDSNTGQPFWNNNLVYVISDLDGDSNGNWSELAKTVNVDKSNVFYLNSANGCQSQLKVNNDGIIASKLNNENNSASVTSCDKQKVSVMIKGDNGLNNGKISFGTGHYIKNGGSTAAEASRIGQNDVQFFAPNTSCSYNNTDDFPRCCEIFKHNLPPGITTEKFEEDYPMCFSGSQINYVKQEPSCDSTAKESYIKVSQDLSKDNWIYALNNINDFKSSISTTMRQACRSTGGCNQIYPTDATCSLVCYDEISINLPAKPYGTLQLGQHFIWPNNNQDNDFAYRPLTSTVKKVCRAMTNKVLDDAGKSTCQKYFSNDINNELNTQNATIKLTYNNQPFNQTVTLSKSDLSQASVSSTYYNVLYRNSNENSNTRAKQYTVTSSLKYDLPTNLYRYTPKSKLLLPKNSLLNSELSKYIDVGYGNLPVSWTWQRKKTDATVQDTVQNYNVELDIKSAVFVNKKLDFNYTCKFGVDDITRNGKKCPLYSQKPNQNPPGFEDCLSRYEYGTCVATYCYNNSNKPFCPKDCTNGVCRESKETLAFRRCIAHGGVGYGKSTCMARECPQSTAVVYRTISLDNPFPGFNGNGRKAGYNWKDLNIVKKYITDTKKYYDKQPMYEITLGPKAITEIRNYNSSVVGGYLDFNLNCTNGKNCRSEFIRTKFRKYFSNTCGMSNNFNACDSR